MSDHAHKITKPTPSNSSTVPESAAQAQLSFSVTPSPANILQLQRLIGNQRVQQLLQRQALVQQHSHSRIMRKDSDELREQSDIIYGANPLSELDARVLIRAIENEDWELVEHLNEKYQLMCKNKLYQIATTGKNSAQRHEWGIGIDKEDGEAFLIEGDKTSTSWSKMVLTHLTPIAHSHPYFEDGPARTTGRYKNRAATVSTTTKEIADHQGLPVGFVRWNDLATSPQGNKSGDARNETLKIFPSGSDMVFAAQKKVARHTVYTAYIAGLKRSLSTTDSNSNSNSSDQAEWVVGNPKSTFDAQTLLQQGIDLDEFKSLIFEIVDARENQDDDKKEFPYVCTLIAFSGATEIWSNTIKNSDVMYGGFTTTKWS